MNWEKLTSPEFKKIVEEVQVCIIAFGVLERHGNHLPLGTDYLNGHKLCTRASEIEPSVVFPPFYFGQIFEARCFPGTIAINSKLLYDLVLNVFEEVHRNGFKKIILYNAHGGNDSFLKYVAQCQLEKDYPYQVYLFNPHTVERSNFYKEVCDTSLHGHACECETSISLYNHKELVKMDTIDEEPFVPQKKLSHINNLFTGLSWYSNYPTHYVGDAKVATIDKGKRLFEYDAKQLASFIKQVKNDKVLKGLSNEFHLKTTH
ncbi:MAG: creatininase family protein [Bacilli bacterium]